jgi:hypothetical protein
MGDDPADDAGVAAVGPATPDVGARRPYRPVRPVGVAVAGTLGTACVLLGASQSGSPFTSKVPGSWFFGVAATAGREASVSSGNARFLGIALVYLGVLVLLATWYELVRMVRHHPGWSVRRLLPLLGAWATPLLVAGPLFSRDAYSYAAQGQMLSVGLDPYRVGPVALGHGAFLSVVDPMWRHATAPYGPGWERLSQWIVQLSGHDVRWSMVGFRVVALVGVSLIAWGLPVIARAAGRDAGLVFVLGAMNPVVLFELLGGAHNDALMLGLLVAGCALATRGRLWVALALCAGAASVKLPALIGAAFIGWWAAPGNAGLRERLGRAASTLVTSAALVALVGLASGLGWRFVGGLANPGVVVSWLDPATALGLLLSHGWHALGFASHRVAFVRGARVGALVMAAVLSVAALVASRSWRDVTALGWSLLAFAVLGPVVWPWYETWGLVFLANSASRWVMRLILVLTAAACLTVVPHFGLLVSGSPGLVATCWLILVGGAVGFVVLRLTRRADAQISSGPLRSLRQPVGRPG